MGLSKQITFEQKSTVEGRTYTDCKRHVRKVISILEISQARGWWRKGCVGLLLQVFPGWRTINKPVKRSEREH